MRKHKKLVAVVTALMMLALCLTGCGGGNADQGGDAVAETRVIFAAVGTSGTYYLVASAIAQVWGGAVAG